MPHWPVAGLQAVPAPQHEEQPQRLVPAEHRSTHVPPAQVWPQPQAELHVAVTQVPLEQFFHAGQLPLRQVPLQPSLPPQAAPLQLGWQAQVPLEQNSAPGQ